MFGSQFLTGQNKNENVTKPGQRVGAVWVKCSVLFDQEAKAKITKHSRIVGMILTVTNAWHRRRYLF